MGEEEIQIYQALDFLFCRPEFPVYEKFDRGIRMLNMITLCNQYSFIPAIQCPHKDYVLLVFGKYPVYKFLLKPVGKMHIK